MKIPSDKVFLDEIRSRGRVSGIGPLGGFAFRLDFSVPKIAVALHAGHAVRSELLPLMALGPAQRLFEEDAGTDFMIHAEPNAMWGLESRAVYDLNRDPENALPLVPERFWGANVYHAAPTPEMNMRSMAGHDAFYRAVGTVISHMLDLFGCCVVYDIHSYNITRQQAKGFEFPPVFNLGTAALDRSGWQRHIETWLDRLRSISLPGIETTVAENEVFGGRGAFCEQLTSWDPRILVLPTEVSKVYMDELTGAIYPEMIKAVQRGLSHAMAGHAVDRP